jgi:YD repeat-containing protein
MAGKLTAVSYPASTSLSFGYDALSRLTSMVDAAGTTSYGYDSLNRLLSEDGPWASDTVSYCYSNARLRSALTLVEPNASAWTQSYGYDGAKRLSSLASPAGTFSYSYCTGLGAGTWDSPLVKKLTLPSSAYITNTFDTNLARLTGTYLKHSSNTNLNYHTYEYNSGNQRTKQTRTDGNYVNCTSDSIGELQSALGKESGGSSRSHEQFGYAYDAAGK